MNELYHASVFFASLEFKCMQRSKPPFGRQRWCNKQKPLDYFRRSPPSTVTLLQPSLHSTARCYCKLPPGGRSAQECFFPSFRLFPNHSLFSLFRLCMHMHVRAVLLWSQIHITLECSSKVTSQGHDLPSSPPTDGSVAALHYQGSATSPISSQPHV